MNALVPYTLAPTRNPLVQWDSSPIIHVILSSDKMRALGYIVSYALSSSAQRVSSHRTKRLVRRKAFSRGAKSMRPVNELNV